MPTLLRVNPALEPLQALLARSLQRVEARLDEQLTTGLAPVQTLVQHVERYRGKMVRPTMALLAGLAAGKPAALGVDVLEGEPDIRHSRIWQYAQTHDNVTITPHIGGFSPDALASVLRHTAARIRQHFARRAA